MKSMNFTDFILEYSKFDGIDKSLTEDEVQELDTDLRRANYQLALDYVKSFLTNFSTYQKKPYNSKQAQIVLDRAEHKFKLSPSDRNNLEVDIFDWENRDNDEMHEKLNPMLTPRNMMNYLDRVWKTGRPHLKKYSEFKVPVQK